MSICTSLYIYSGQSMPVMISIILWSKEPLWEDRIIFKTLGNGETVGTKWNLSRESKSNTKVNKKYKRDWRNGGKDGVRDLEGCGT